MRSIFFTFVAALIFTMRNATSAQNISPSIYFYFPGDLHDDTTFQWSSGNGRLHPLQTGNYIECDGESQDFTLTLGKKKAHLTLKNTGEAPVFVRCSLLKNRTPSMKETDLFSARSVLGEIQTMSGESVYDSLSDFYSEQFHYRPLSEIEMQNGAIGELLTLKCGDSVFVSLWERPSGREIRNGSTIKERRRALWISKDGVVSDVSFPELNNKSILQVARHGSQFYFELREKNPAIGMLVHDKASNSNSLMPNPIPIKGHILGTTIINDTLIVVSAIKNEHAVHVTTILDARVIKAVSFPLDYPIVDHGRVRSISRDPAYGNMIDKGAYPTKISFGKNSVWITQDKTYCEEANCGTSSIVTRLDLKTEEELSRTLRNPKGKKVCTNVLEPYVFWMRGGKEIQIIDFNSGKVINRIPLTESTAQTHLRYFRYSSVNYMEYQYDRISPPYFDFFSLDQVGSDSVSLRAGVHYFEIPKSEITKPKGGPDWGLTNYAEYSYLNGKITGQFTFDDHRQVLNKTMDDYELDYWIVDRAYVRCGKSMLAFYHESESKSIRIVEFTE